MKKAMFPLFLLCLLLASACGNSSNNSSSSDVTDDQLGEKALSTITYQAENGPVEVPAHPERVVVLSSFAGNVMALDVNLVGVDSWSKMNPRFDEKLKDVQEVSDENLEKIIDLQPDLIIGLSMTKHVDKLKQIAPTVTFTYGKVDYLTQHIEIGKLLNKEKEAQAWVADFKKRAQQAGEEIRAKIGKDATVSVMEKFDKQLYVFGDNWGRGTEILYQEMRLNMPDKVKEMALKDGYYAISLEVLPDFAGDYVILSKNNDGDSSFREDLYKNIPAVKNKRLFEVNAKEFYFNDPLTLDFQLDFFLQRFLEK
jgi:iron complex transport system substrate-binding protein